MRTRLTSLLGGLLLLALPLLSDAGPTPVGATYGGAIGCDPSVITCGAFPTSFSFLCNGTGAVLDCPQWFAPDWADTTGQRFFGITNRTNPPRCVQSTDGGSTFGLCPSNPFAAAVDIFGAFFAVASDGSLISAAQDAPDNCIIRRSTNYGTSWSTVYTDTTAGVSCGVSFGTPTPNNLRCAPTGGYCVLVNRDAAFALWAVFSTDNGANWSKGVAFTIVNGNQQVNEATDGTRGSLTRLGINYGGAQPLGEQIFSDWDNTTATPAPGTGDTSANGATALVFNGSETVIAGPGGTATTTYHRYDIAGGIPLEIGNGFIPAGAPAFVNGPNFMAHGFGSIGYFITRNLAGTNVNVYISLDGFDNVSLLSSNAPTTALIGACCVGDIHTFNGKIYFTGAGTASQAWLARIQ